MYKTAILFLALFIGSTTLHAQQKVAPAVDGVELHSEGSLYWLQFDKDADDLWPTLKDFWANEGITLKREKPLLGYMQTDWTKDLLVERMLSIILSDQAPERRERFRLRLERLPDNQGTRVFINHSAYGILFDEEAVYTGYLPSSPQLEIEMLSRLALYSGASSEQADQMVSSFSVRELAAKRINDNQYDIDVPGSLNFIRGKLTRVLDRMDADTIDADVLATGKFVAAFNKAPELFDTNEGWDVDDSSDLEESGFNNYSSSNKNKPTSLLYQFKLAATENSVIISISSAPGSSDEGDSLRQFSETIARNLQAK